MLSAVHSSIYVFICLRLVVLTRSVVLGPADYTRRRLDQLVLLGVDTETAFCRHDFVHYVDAGYRFFDLSVVRRGGLFYWSVSGSSSESSRREITPDLRQLAASSSRYRFEMFVVRITVDDVEEDGTMKTTSSRRSRRAASGRILLDILRREFDFRLARSTMVRDATVGEILATGSNVAAFVRDLDEFLHAADNDDDVASVGLPVRNFFAVDEIVSDELDLSDAYDDVGDVIVRRHGGFNALTQLVIHVSDNDDATIAKSSTLAGRLVFGLFPFCLIFAALVCFRRPFACRRRPCSGFVRVGSSRDRRPVSLSADESVVPALRRLAAGILELPSVYSLPPLLPDAVSRLTVGVGSTALLLVVALMIFAQTGLDDNDNSSRILSQRTLPLVGVCLTSEPEAVSILLGRWLARPGQYRVNIVTVRRGPCGDRSTKPRCTVSGAPLLAPSDRNQSAMARLAALANVGTIRRQVSLRHAGSPLTGSGGLRSLFVCPPVAFAYVIASRDEGRVVAWNQLGEGESRDFDEAEFPMDSSVVVYVGTVWNRWLQVYSANVQRLIEFGRDVYLRGTESRGGVGLVYVTHTRRHLASSCRSAPPVDTLLNITRWDDRIAAADQQQQQPRQPTTP